MQNTQGKIMVSLLLKPIVHLRFSEWVRVRRGRAGVTQQELANALGISTQTVSNWEKERSIPTLTIGQTAKLCEVLKCEFRDIPVDEVTQ